MKVRISLKDPDGFSTSVDEAVEKDVAALGLPKDEAEQVYYKRCEKVWKAIAPWVQYQEYVTLEFDTEAGTATVCKL